ncbi:hypothetical protein B0H17DRAFT_1127423 [Mycena rosella]|uniref:Uncharacterized protein n=1 Tax=Mycena rosella TaxID=1033263 RepID=A0AAD7E1L2_MYCRO|nr:hypothetical protein B0H17DRAFT_1127423 [Mycena rosella]
MAQILSAAPFFLLDPHYLAFPSPYFGPSLHLKPSATRLAAFRTLNSPTKMWMRSNSRPTAPSSPSAADGWMRLIVFRPPSADRRRPPSLRRHPPLRGRHLLSSSTTLSFDNALTLSTTPSPTTTSFDDDLAGFNDALLPSTTATSVRGDGVCLQATSSKTQDAVKTSRKLQDVVKNFKSFKTQPPSRLKPSRRLETTSARRPRARQDHQHLIKTQDLGGIPCKSKIPSRQDPQDAAQELKLKLKFKPRNISLGGSRPGWEPAQGSRFASRDARHLKASSPSKMLQERQDQDHASRFKTVGGSFARRLKTSRGSAQNKPTGGSGLKISRPQDAQDLWGILH